MKWFNAPPHRPHRHKHVILRQNLFCREDLTPPSYLKEWHRHDVRISFYALILEKGVKLPPKHLEKGVKTPLKQLEKGVKQHKKGCKAPPSFH